MLILISLVWSLTATYFIYKIIFYINRFRENKMTSSATSMTLGIFFISYYSLFYYIEFVTFRLENWEFYHDVLTDISILGVYLLLIDICTNVVRKMERQ